MRLYRFEILTNLLSYQRRIRMSGAQKKLKYESQSNTSAYNKDAGSREKQKI